MPLSQRFSERSAFLRDPFEARDPNQQAFCRARLKPMLNLSIFNQKQAVHG
jgi:hypothetical protein